MPDGTLTAAQLFPPSPALDALADQLEAAREAVNIATAHRDAVEEQFNDALAAYMGDLDLDWPLALEAFTPYGTPNTWGFEALQKWNRMPDGGATHNVYFFGDMSPTTQQYIFTVAIPANASSHQLKQTADGIRHLVTHVRPGGFTDQAHTADWQLFAIRTVSDQHGAYYLARCPDDTWAICQEDTPSLDDAPFHGHLDDALVFIRSRLPT